MNLDLVARLVQHARYLPAGVHPAGRALALVPALVDALPDVPLPDDDEAPSFPVACSELLAAAVDQALRSAIDDALAAARPPALPELSERLQNDPLTQGLRRLVGEGLTLSNAAACVVAFDYARLCLSALAAPGPLLREGVAAINALPPEKKGLALARVAAAMQARLAWTAHDLAIGGSRPPALLSVIAANPLVFLYAAGTFAKGVDVALLAGVCQAPVPAAMVRDATLAFDATLRDTVDRLQARRGTPADHSFALRFNVPDLVGRGAEAALTVLRAEPDAWAYLLPQLAAGVSEAALTKAGLSPAGVAELRRPDVAVAVAATLSGTLRALQVWEVLSAVVASLSPKGEATIARQLLVPRGGPVVATIVAVSTGMLRGAVAEPVALSREVSEAVVAWRSSLGANAVASDDGSVALFAFNDVARGVSFALSLRERPAAGLPVPAASVATGTVGGGTDGAVVRLSGPAVQDALRLLAQVPLDMRPPNAPTLSQVALHEGSLRGSGVVAHNSTLEALRARRPRSAGRRRPGWANEAWEDEHGVLVHIAIAGLSGATELARCTPADWEALCAAGEPASTSLWGPPKNRSSTIPAGDPFGNHDPFGVAASRANPNPQAPAGAPTGDPFADPFAAPDAPPPRPSPARAQ